MEERDATAAVADVLDPIAQQLREGLIGASAADLRALASHLGLKRLPHAVAAYLRIVGRDVWVTQALFPGYFPFEVGTLLGDAVDALDFAATLGAPAHLLRGGIPYVGTAEEQWWLASGDADPQIWIAAEGGVLHEGRRFTDDLARRVQFALAEFSRLRGRVDEGFPESGGFSPESLRVLHAMGVPDNATSRIERSGEEERQRAVEMRSRLVD